MVDGNSEIKYVFEQNAVKPRKLKYSDIAVLARKNEDVAKITAALNDKDIPVVMECYVDCNHKELRLVRLLLNYMIDDSPLLKAEIANLLFDVKTATIIEGKQNVDFGKLNTLKNRLRTLPVADIVKTLIIELDLFNRCKKWGVAAQRERALQALIEDAKAFDENAATVGEASSIEHYLIHLDEEGVTVKEGFFEEGVHVVTYHRSKGLQWNIVILCSLDDDSLNEKKLMKHFVFGTNYVRLTEPTADKLYSDYYLTCLPAFVVSANLTDEMMSDIKNLDTYSQHKDRIYYESQRILYVGVTRARDYLVTTSLEGRKMSWLEASGIKPVIAGTDDYRAIWGAGKGRSMSRFVQIVDDGSYVSMPEPEHYLCRSERTAQTEYDEKYLSPSKMSDHALAQSVKSKVLYPVQDEIPRTIKVGSGDEYDIMGTCIHNIFAIYSQEIDADEMCEKAQRIIDAFGMIKMLPNVDSILVSIAALYQYLEKLYGKPCKIAHEVPFRREFDGCVISGEMDLLWYTSPTECVLIDFKNYPGDMSKALSPSNKEEYVGKYAVQLKAYEEALLEAGLKVKAKLIYYSVLGYLVELED